MASNYRNESTELALPRSNGSRDPLLPLGNTAPSENVNFAALRMGKFEGHYQRNISLRETIGFRRFTGSFTTHIIPAILSEYSEQASQSQHQEIKKAADLELSGDVALFQSITHSWQLTDEEASQALGYEDPNFAASLFRGLNSIRQRDASDRLHLLIAIDVGLVELYRDQETVAKWLRAPQEMLNAKPPLNLITKGTYADMLRVAQYVEYLAGL